MAESDSFEVISFRGPVSLRDRVAKSAKKLGVARSVIQREALETYLVLVERGLRVSRAQPGAFGDDTSGEAGG